MKILGAGLAGLIAGVLNQDAFIFEPFGKRKAHQALLRFRSPQIGEAVGIPFREVKVYKGIWDKGPVKLSPDNICKYSRKVSGKISYRSICDLSVEHRWLAPTDFQERLQVMCEPRIVYNCDIENERFLPDHTISTLPMNVLAGMLKIPSPMPGDQTKVIMPIYVNRYRIPDCDVYMTNYYTGFDTSVYRASITENILIIESTDLINWGQVGEVKESFGIQDIELESELINFKELNGKMTSIDEGLRKAFILKVTMEQRIYSLGRFAVWKNLVLDDVYKDILKIKQFMNRDNYDHYREI